jgi:endonuclease YncB( thermonuclease family)
MAPVRSSTLLALAVGLAAFAALAGIALRRDDGPVSGRPRVVDGDSLDFAGKAVRLHGLDAPELGQTCSQGERTIACGRVARAELARLVAGGDVSCAIVGRDRYGRALGRCRSGETDIGAALVRGGFAVEFGGYAAEEAEARAAARGLWAMSFERPQAWRRRHATPPK